MRTESDQGLIVMKTAEYRRERSSSLGHNVLISILIALVAVLLYRQFKPSLASRFDDHAVSRTITPRGNLADDERSTIDLFKQTSPSVVHITTTSVRQDVFTRNMFEIPAGTGSGVVWDQQGHIVTNLHVIRDATGATVTLSDNSSFDAVLVGYDSDHDLAVLKIKAPTEKLKPISIGTSRDLEVGQKVFAIGSPFQFDMTLTTGIISGLDRTIDTGDTRIHGAIQTDAAINPGNSGGPLLDSASRLVGVNTAIFSESGGSHGIGFAVPVDLVNLVVPDLIRDGTIDRPWLGVVVVENLWLNGARLKGVGIKFVMQDSPAGRAGLRAIERDPDSPRGWSGDRIIEVDGKPVDSRRDLLSLLSQRRPGEKVRLKIVRDDMTTDVEILLEARPKQEQ